MRKFLAPLLLALAGAGALAGCSLHVGPYAAVVDGTTISQGALNASLASASSNTGYLCSVTSGQPAQLLTTGAGTGTYDIGFTDFVLRTLVRGKLAADEAARQHVTVTTSFLGPIANEQLDSTLGSAVQGCTGTGAAILAKLNPDLRNSLLTFYESLDALSAAKQGITLTNDGLTRYANTHPQLSEKACLDYIQAPSLKVAAQAIAAVKKGTPFATEAQKVTTATSTTVPCTPLGEFPSQLAATFAALNVGQVSAPVTYQGNIYVFQLTGRQPATAQEFLQSVLDNLQATFRDVVVKIDASGSVQLDPAYGSWSKVESNTGPISGPTSPPSKFLLNAAAISATPAAPTSTAPAGGNGG